MHMCGNQDSKVVRLEYCFVLRWDIGTLVPRNNIIIYS